MSAVDLRIAINGRAGDVNGVFMVLIWGMVVYVKNTEADAGVGEIPADRDSDSGQAIIGQGIRSSNDGKYVDAGRQTADGGDFGVRKRRATKKRVGCHGRLKNDRFWIRL